MNYLYAIIMLFMWIAGIVVAKGFWSTFFAITFCPYAMYLVIEKLLLINNLL